MQVFILFFFSQNHLGFASSYLQCRVCLSDKELEVMAKYGAAIAHCPLSNFYFADVLLRVKHCLKLGVKVKPINMLPSQPDKMIHAQVRNMALTQAAEVFTLLAKNLMAISKP